MKPKKLTLEACEHINRPENPSFNNGYLDGWNNAIEAMQQHKAKKKGKRVKDITDNDIQNLIARIEELEKSSVKFDEKIVLEGYSFMDSFSATPKRIVG